MRVGDPAWQRAVADWGRPIRTSQHPEQPNRGLLPVRHMIKRGIHWTVRRPGLSCGMLVRIYDPRI